MGFVKNCFILQIACLVVYAAFCSPSDAGVGHYRFVVREAHYKRLCSSKKMLTVNKQFPGPTIYARKGDTIYVKVINKSKFNITIHWHGVKQPRNPWHDGPNYITQCSIMPKKSFLYKIILSTEEGTIWWHAHSAWARATVHGAFIIYPKKGTEYPFPEPHAEIPIVISEWWKMEIKDVLSLLYQTGGDPNTSDAYTINGQPGDLYPCSKKGTFKALVKYGKTYLLRIVNAGMNELHFFAIAKHPITVVGIDGSYTKPFTNDFIVIGPGQSVDALFHANQHPGRYYMAARPYSSSADVPFDNTTTTAIIQYKCKDTAEDINDTNTTESEELASYHGPPPLLPKLPYYNDTRSFLYFAQSLRSLASTEHPCDLPLEINTKLVTTLSVNAVTCEANNTCQGPNGTRFAASMNNISFTPPSKDILEAYYYQVEGIFTKDFPRFPPLVFNFTADYLPLEYEIPQPGTRVLVLKYNSTVEMVFQGTNVVGGIDHPMHLHGYSFYVVGTGLGNYNPVRDPLTFNLVDPPLRNTVIVPINGWSVIRFRANNPGVWFMHCHLERHLTWGMDTVVIVKNGGSWKTSILPPPDYMPPCSSEDYSRRTP
ncbi:unnamed protein product [Rhodiola kirilowii]